MDQYIDPVTTEPISDNRLISFTQLNNEFYFDIVTLVKHFMFTGKMENPLNRQQLPDDVIHRVLTYIDVPVHVNYCQLSGNFRFNILNKIGDLIIDIHKSIDATSIWMGHIPLYVNITREDGTSERTELYSHDLDTRFIDIYPDVTTINIRIYISLRVLGGSGLSDTPDRMKKLFLYGSMNNIVDLVPAIYGIDPYTPDEPTPMMRDIIINFIRSNSDTEYLLPGMSRLLHNTYLTTDMAREISSHIYPTLNGLALDSYERKCIIYLLLILYSRVVDPYNLERSGSEMYFWRNRYVRPSYELPPWAVYPTI